MQGITEIRKANQNTAHSEKARLLTSFAPQANGNIILRHDGRVKYLETKEDVNDFLSEIKGKNEDQVRVVIRSRYLKQPAH